MDLRQFEYIISLAETQSITKTAEKVFVSPSALSQYLSKLEKELGTPLFKRVKGAWPLTEAGKIYVNAAQDIIKCFRQMNKNIQDIVICEGGVISIGISSNKSSLMFASVFPRFSIKYPKVKIKLSEGRTREINSLAEKGLLDIAFSTTGIEYPGLTYKTLLHERFVLSVPKTHRLASLAKNTPKGKLATVDLSLFKNEHFMLPNPSMTLRIIMDKMFAKAGFTPNILFESNSPEALYNLVDSGYGISIIPIGNIKPESSSVFFFTNPLGEWENIVVYATGSHLSQAEKYFIDLAQDFFTSQYGYFDDMYVSR